MGEINQCVLTHLPSCHANVHRTVSNLLNVSSVFLLFCVRVFLFFLYLPLDLDADYYMRPWKIYKASMDNIKTSAESDETWVQLATTNHDLLKRILVPIGMSEKTVSKPIKAMWR